jgi:hypothetical protein
MAKIQQLLASTIQETARLIHCSAPFMAILKLTQPHQGGSKARHA